MTDLNEEYPLYTPPVDLSERLYLLFENPDFLLGVQIAIFLVIFFCLLDWYIDRE